MVLNHELLLNKWKELTESSKTYTDSAGNTVTVSIRQRGDEESLELV